MVHPSTHFLNKMIAQQEGGEATIQTPAPSAAVPPAIPGTPPPAQPTPPSAPQDADLAALRQQLAQREAELAQAKLQGDMAMRELGEVSNRFSSLEQQVGTLSQERENALRDLAQVRRMQELTPKLDELQYFDKEQAEELNSKIITPLIQKLADQHQREIDEVRKATEARVAETTKQIGSLSEAQRTAMYKRTEADVKAAFPDFNAFSDTAQFKQFLDEKPMPFSSTTFGSDLRYAYDNFDSETMKAILAEFKKRTTGSAPTFQQVAGVAPTGLAASQPAVPDQQPTYSFKEYETKRNRKLVGMMTPEERKAWPAYQEGFFKAQAEGRVTE